MRHLEGLGINSNGSVIVGYSGALDGSSTRDFRWTAAGGMQSLGALGRDLSSSASGVTAEGATVVGYSSADSLSGANGFRAFLWTSQLGMVDLDAYLPTQGLGLTGWALESATISADGSAIAGTGTFNGRASAFLVTGVPEPASLGLFALGGTLLVRPRRN